MKDHRRSQAVLLSKRANIFYLEHVRVLQQDDRIVYLTEAQDGLQKFVAIPDKNTAFILLGKGTSITDSAARKLAESNVMLGFCGSGGSPLFAELDIAFLSPQDEYRPPEYAQRWFRLWVDDKSRLELAKQFLLYRSAIDRRLLPKQGVDAPAQLFADFESRVAAGETTTQLLGAEAMFAKGLYQIMASAWGIKFARDAGKRKSESPEQKVNSFLDHGNYIAYGYAATCLHGLGIPFFLPVLHGKTRRGALVFDVADLFKDYLVMPLAFEAGAKGLAERVFRAKLIEYSIKLGILDEVMTFVRDVPEKVTLNQQLATSTR